MSEDIDRLKEFNKQQGDIINRLKSIIERMDHQTADYIAWDIVKGHFIWILEGGIDNFADQNFGDPE